MAVAKSGGTRSPREIDLTSRYRGGIYVDNGVNDFWDTAVHAQTVIDDIGALYESAAEPDPGYCLDFTAGRYDDFVGDFPLPTETIWFREKASASSGGRRRPRGRPRRRRSSPRRALRARPRLPVGPRSQWLFRRRSEGRPRALRNAPAADTFALGADVAIEYAVFLPAGYYDLRSRWKTYPLLLVLLDRDQSFDDAVELTTVQGALAANGFAQQAVVVMVRGEREAQELPGYGFFTDQAAAEFAGNYRRMLEINLLDHLQNRYRLRSRVPDL
ncbi:MAG: hypothetical protein M5R36_22645 [Deltaproteobacteria bacterium]|nr:hypothetical protein [Deltaproteobacteria bacterium]